MGKEPNLINAAEAAPIKSREWDLTVLGAGTARLVSAKIVQGVEAARILVLEEHDHIGRDHIDQHIGP